ncbi:MAG TPA: hypothetical protein VKE42_03760 [Candidatus Cybelea sp.]|nr:hypothetical protein [Candidatus Cybelea sp.]
MRAIVAAAPPGVELRQQKRLGAFDGRAVVAAERFGRNRATGIACACRRLEEIAPSALERLAPNVAGQGQG